MDGIETRTYNLYLAAKKHTTPSAALDAAWTWFTENGTDAMPLAFDTETTGTTWGMPQSYGSISANCPIVFGISACLPGPDRLHLLWARRGTPMWAWLLDKLGTECPKVGHNIRYDLRVCRAQGIRISPHADCTLTMARIIYDRKRKFDLQTMAEMMCAHISDWCTPVRKELTRLRREFKKSGADRKPNYSDVPDAVMGPYSMTDSFLCFLLAVRLRPQIDAEFAELYARERAVIDLIADVEDAGLLFDWKTALSGRTKLKARSAAICSDLRRIVGNPNLNLNASMQVWDALRAFGVPASSMMKDGSKTTQNKVLVGLWEHCRPRVAVQIVPWIAKLLTYRAIGKICGTYLLALARRARVAGGRVYCSINPTNSRTGRMSSSGPNLQNIPRTSRIGAVIKQCFAVETNWRHFYFDYSSMEFFVFGCMAGEQAIIDAYNAGEDLHLAMSKRIYADEKQAKAQRQAIKTVDFAIIYGAGDGKIASQLSWSTDEAADLRSMYYRTFPAIPAFIKECDERLRRQGYVEDWFGRKYHLREGYKAVNALVQGGCASIFKIALLNIRASGMLTDTCKIILPVHDEAQFARLRPTGQLGAGAERIWARRVIACMTDIPQLMKRGFKLRVDVKCSDSSWAEKTEYYILKGAAK